MIKNGQKIILRTVFYKAAENQVERLENEIIHSYIVIGNDCVKKCC